MKFVRCMAGFPTNPGSYFLGRAQIETPRELLQQVFPWLRKWQVRFRQRVSGKNWKNGGLDERDIAGDNFVKLLAHLRVVLLQDLAVLQAGQSIFEPSMLWHFYPGGGPQIGVVFALKTSVLPIHPPQS
jgi:hypothetical protein